MKKLSIIIFLMLMLPLASAVEFNFASQFQSGETMIGIISGNFLEPILKNKISFYRGHVKIPIEFDVTEIDDEFYLYAQLSKPEGNYTFKIEDVKYIDTAKITDDDLVFNFSITNQTADFSVRPGFVLTDTQFSLKLQSLSPSKITISTSTSADSGEVILKSGEEKNANFNVGGMQAALNTLTLKSANTEYKVPVYFFLNETQYDKVKKFRLEPNEMEISLDINTNITKSFFLENTGTEDLSGINLTLSDSIEPYAMLSTNYIQSLKSSSSVKIELLVASPDDEGTITGEVRAMASNYLFDSMNLKISFIKDYVPSEDEYSPAPISDDTDKTGSSSYGAIIGYALIAILIGVGAWFFFKKYKKAQGPATILDKAKRK